MSSVLVTGGRGVLGSVLVARLGGRADVRVLSRRTPDDPAVVRGDLETGEGIVAALDGVDVIAHCATAADYRRPRRDVEQTRRLLLAAGDRRPHIVYISIVGIDEIPFRYYKAKLECEELIKDSGLPWTIFRATQFHELALLFLHLMTKLPLVIVPRGMKGQPVDVDEVAARMAGLVLGEPAGHAPDMGGPRIEDAAEMVRTYLDMTKRRRPVVQAPLPGKVMAGFRAGHHMVTGVDGTHGERTFTEYLRDKVRPDGSIDTPYKLRR
jgi:uncharacterized protein YbjT (DUF2867 family)